MNSLHGHVFYPVGSRVSLQATVLGSDGHWTLQRLRFLAVMVTGHYRGYGFKQWWTLDRGYGFK